MARENSEEQQEAIRFNRLDDLADRVAPREIAGQIRSDRDRWRRTAISGFQDFRISAFTPRPGLRSA